MKRWVILLYITTLVASIEPIKAGRANILAIDVIQKSFLKRPNFLSKFRDITPTFRHTIPSFQLFCERYRYHGSTSGFFKSWGGGKDALVPLASLGIAKVALAQDDDSSENAQDKIDPKQLLADWYRKQGTWKLETAIVVVGNTGVGKSTLIASLQGASLNKTSEGKVELNSTQDPTKYPKIKKGEHLQTLYPEIFECQDKLFFMECHRFHNFQDKDHNMVHEVTLESMLGSINHLKLVMIANYRELTVDEGRGFKELVYHCSSTFQPDVFSSIMWVITNTPANWDQGDKEDILKKIRDLERSELSQLSSQQRWGTGVEWFESAFRFFLLNIPEKAPEGKDLREEIKKTEDSRKIFESITENNLFLFDPMQNQSRTVLVENLKKLEHTPNNIETFN